MISKNVYLREGQIFQQGKKESNWLWSFVVLFDTHFKQIGSVYNRIKSGCPGKNIPLSEVLFKLLFITVWPKNELLVN